MPVKVFGVIGAGQMGNGIAQVAAAASVNVIMNDIAEEFVERGRATIDKILSRNVEKEKITSEEKDAILGRVQTSVDVNDMADADFVVEAATEKEEIKFQLFRDLNRICPPEAILATKRRRFPSAESSHRRAGRTR